MEDQKDKILNFSSPICNFSIFIHSLNSLNSSPICVSQLRRYLSKPIHSSSFTLLSQKIHQIPNFSSLFDSHSRLRRTHSRLHTKIISSNTLTSSNPFLIQNRTRSSPVAIYTRNPQFAHHLREIPNAHTNRRVGSPSS